MVSQFTFAFVGSATARKGFDFVLEAMNRLLSEGISIRILVAGIIDRSLVAGRERLLENVCEYGMISQRQLSSILSERSLPIITLPS